MPSEVATDLLRDLKDARNLFSDEEPRDRIFEQAIYDLDHERSNTHDVLKTAQYVRDSVSHLQLNDERLRPVLHAILVNIVTLIPQLEEEAEQN